MSRTTPPQTVQRAAGALRAGRPGDALAALGDAPAGADALYLRALALSALGRTQEAEPAFDAAADAGAPLGELRLNQANMRRRAGRHDAALAACAAAEAAGAAPAPLGVARGASLAALGRLAEARAAYEAALAAAPDDHAALTGLGGLLNRLGQPEAAAPLLDRALARRRTAPALNNRASAARRLGQLTEELGLLREAAALAPRDPDVLANRARAAARAGQKAEAVAGFVAALSADPLNAHTHRDLARYLFEAGERAHLLRGYDAVPEAAPAGVRARLLVQAAGFAARADMRAEAEDRYARALALVPDLPAGLAGLADLREGAARAEAWERAYAAAPGDPGLRLGYAWHLLRDQDAPEAAERVLARPVPPAHAQARLAYDGVCARLLGRDRYEAVHDAHSLAGTRQIAPPPGETLAGFLAAVEDALAPHFTGDGAPIDQTLFGGEQSRGDLWATRDPVLAQLRAALLEAATSFRDDLPVPPGHPARGRGPLTCGAAWSVRLTSGGGHRDHFHGRGTISSAHYVRVPAAMSPAGAAGDRPGQLRLGRPDLDRPDLPATRHVVPEPGLVALFPSYLWHGVEPFEATEPRLTTPADFVARTGGPGL